MTNEIQQFLSLTGTILGLNIMAMFGVWAAAGLVNEAKKIIDLSNDGN